MVFINSTTINLPLQPVRLIYSSNTAEGVLFSMNLKFVADKAYAQNRIINFFKLSKIYPEIQRTKKRS